MAEITEICNRLWRIIDEKLDLIFEISKIKFLFCFRQPRK